MSMPQRPPAPKAVGSPPTGPAPEPPVAAKPPRTVSPEAAPRPGHSFANMTLHGRGPRGGLPVGHAGDRAERGADQVAEQVVRGRLGGGGPPGNDPHTRASGGPQAVGQPMGPEPRGPRIPGTLGASVLALQQGGDPLPESLRLDYEATTGADLRGVRLHAGRAATTWNQGLRARAFTLGDHIHFRGPLLGETPGASAPARRLLAHELTHVLQQRAAGVAWIQRQEVAPDFAPKPPVEQAREDVSNALLVAGRKVGQAIQNRDAGSPLPPDVFNAYRRFFPGSDLSRLDLLGARIAEAGRWIDTMPFDVIPSPVPPGYRDAALHQTGLGVPGLHAAAIQPPLSADVYIALYPAWYADPSMRGPKVLHELFHFFPDVRHAPAGAPSEASWQNARAYQGLVGTLAGLPEGKGITAMFPP